MALYYPQPILKSLSQGDRIAFVRQLKKMSQKKLGEEIGIKSNRVRNLVCRMERMDRSIRQDKVRKIAEVLDINPKMIERWAFREPEDLYYEMLWIEELCPDFILRNTIRINPKNPTHEILSEKYAEWKKMRRMYGDGKIDYEEYWDWKLKRPDGREDIKDYEESDD